MCVHYPLLIKMLSNSPTRCDCIPRLIISQCRIIPVKSGINTSHRICTFKNVLLYIPMFTKTLRNAPRCTRIRQNDTPRACPRYRHDSPLRTQEKA